MQNKVIIQSTNPISNDFTSVPTLSSGVDYLTATIGKSTDSTKYQAGLALTWTLGMTQANGSFIIANGSTFTADVSLANQTQPITTGWDGQNETRTRHCNAPSLASEF